MTAVVSVRPLNTHDLGVLLPLHREAFAGYMHTRLGSRYLTIFLRWFLTDPAALAFGAFDDNGALVGYVFGAPPQAFSELQRVVRLVAVAGLVSHPRLLARRDIWRAIRARVQSPRVARRRDDSADFEVHLVGIGVDSQARDLGIGRELISTFEAAARRRGYLSAFLAVYPTNKPARRLYERMGWTLLPNEAGGVTLGYQRNLAGSDPNDGRTVDRPHRPA